MIKNIDTSIPGSSLFKSVTSIIIIVICIVLFLNYTQGLTDKAESISRQRVLNQINYSLSMMLYDFTVKGKQQDLKKFDHENPFMVLAIYAGLPDNYYGAFQELPENPEPGWYFVKKYSQAIYIDRAARQYVFMVNYSQANQDEVGQLLLNLDSAVDRSQ